MDQSAGRRLLTAASALLVALGLCGAAEAKDAAAGAAAAPQGDVEYIVPVVALADAGDAKRLVDRLVKARVPYYVEPIATVRGTVYRVRVGPFADRTAAAMARARLQTMNLDPGAIITKQ